LIIIDSLPFMPSCDRSEGNDRYRDGEQMRQRIESSERGNSGQAQHIRQMITRAADYEVIVGWARRSHQLTIAAAMFDLFSSDLRSRQHIINLRMIEEPETAVNGGLAFLH
jgi:hypothetical protein